MKKMFPAATILLLTLLLLAGALAGGCMGQKTNYTLRIIPPRNLEFPLQGSWEIVSLLQDDTDDIDDADGTNGTAAAGEPAREWIGKTLHFADQYALIGEHLLLNPSYQVKRVEAEGYLLYHHQAFPGGFRFKNTEIEVFTLSDSHLFFCELLRENDGELLLNLFNNSYLVKKVADKVDETVFTPFITANANADESGADTSALIDTGRPEDAPANQTGVLLGLCAPVKNDQGNTGTQYRTLWLALTDRELAPVLEAETILFPRRSGFYRLQVVRKAEGKAEEDFLVVDNIMGKEEKEPPAETPPLSDAVEPALTIDPARWEGKEGYIYRRINYIGNDYVSVEERLKQSFLSGGSASEGSRLQIFAVDSLPAMKPVKISDLAGPEALAAMEHGHQKLTQQLEAEQIVPHLWDEDNYGLARKMGYWIFKGRVNYQEKDRKEKDSGEENKVNEELQVKTYGNMNYADYNITVIPPDHVVFYNNLNIPWTRVKNHVPSTVDVFTSPGKDMAMVVTDTEIIVYRMHQGNLAAPPLERIPLREGEEVIMAEWALGHYVENWTLTFQTYLAGESTD